MKKLVLPLLLSGFIVACATHEPPAEGLKVQESESGELTIWSEKEQRYLTIDGFWREYANERGGLTWGEGKEYPEYSQVKEFDTFMVETEKGKCLMEFFHERWRRANDVRRWHERMNRFGGCPYVFD